VFFQGFLILSQNFVYIVFFPVILLLICVFSVLLLCILTVSVFVLYLCFCAGSIVDTCAAVIPAR
jgi:hypothetical protein